MVPQLAMLGLNLLNTGAKYGMAHKAMKSQKKLGKLQNRHNVNQANRFLSQSEEDIARGRRKLDESLFARGVGDSSIREGDLAYYDRGAARQMEGARENVKLASLGMKDFKKQLQRQKMAMMLDLGMGVANAGLGSWAMGSMAPQPQAPAWAMNNFRGSLGL